MQMNFLLILVSICSAHIYAARILSIFPIPFAKQYAFIEPLLKDLAARGHEITSITNYPQKANVNNFRDVVVEKNKHLFDDFQSFSMENIDGNYYKIVDEMYKNAYQVCINILSDTNVRRIIDNESFDLIILEVCFSEAFYGLAEYLKAPIVGVSYFGTYTPVEEMVGNISPISYIPQFILPLREMNFWQRTLNVILNVVEWCHYKFKYVSVQKQIYEFYFPNATLTFNEAQRNISLVLLNDHFSLTQARPLVPNMIEVAGLNIVTQADPLPAEIKFLLDNASQGAILMTYDPAYNNEKTNLFLQQFATMSEIVLWKSAQSFNNLPANVYISSSYNVPSIMSHPNIKLYITASDLLNVVESAYHGVPIMTVISTKNQNDCVDYIKRVGNGFSIKLHTISKRTLANAFREILSNSYYAEHAKTLSLRFRDQQNSPLERAVYWIEYVLRHNGAAHLRNRGQNLSWWQFYNLDVFLLLLSLFILVIISALVALKFLLIFIWKVKLRKDVLNIKKRQ